MKIGKSEAVAALRQSARRLRAEAAVLEEKADLLERVETDLADRSDGQSAALSKDSAGEGVMDTLGHVWTSEAAGAYIATIEERERRLRESDYDVDVDTGMLEVSRTRLERLRGHYGDTLDIQDVAVVFLDAGVCRSNAATRKLRVGRAKAKVYEYVKKSASWQRSRENTMQFVDIDAARVSGDLGGEMGEVVGG